MDLEIRIRAFTELGRHLQNLSPEERAMLIQRAADSNAWFDERNVTHALNGIIALLDEQPLRKWLAQYEMASMHPKRIGVIMAGNIPLVGFHDVLCVLLSGHLLHAKLSSDDPFLTKWLLQKMTALEPALAAQIQYVEMLKDVDAVIATGSDNTSRYFAHYFAQKPHIIRRNRTSIGILNGQEKPEELKALGQDILQYYGLGCRNVSKVFVPEEYGFARFFEAIEDLQEVLYHHKYHNNYDYNKSILLVNMVPHLDNGFLTVTRNADLVSPISVLYYDTYTGPSDLTQKISASKDKIQCIVSSGAWYPGSIPFGQAQCPAVSDYADGVDTMEFLLSLR